jgi:hypothetical protein
MGVLLHNSGKEKIYHAEPDDLTSSSLPREIPQLQGILFDPSNSSLLSKPTNSARELQREIRHRRKRKVEEMFTSFRDRQLAFRKQIKHKHMMDSCREQFHPNAKRKQLSDATHDASDVEPVKKKSIVAAKSVPISTNVSTLFLTAPKPIDRSHDQLPTKRSAQPILKLPKHPMFPFSVCVRQ